MPDELKQPDITRYKKNGDYYIKDIRITSPALDSGGYSLITGHQGRGGIWSHLEIYENIEDNYVSGELTVEDGQNLLVHLPIIGQETLTIEYITPGVDSEFVKQTFIIYKIGSRLIHKEGQKYQLYKLHFCSPEKMSDLQIKVHQSYNGTISDTVKKIWKTNFQNTITPLIDVTPSENIHRFIIPYWTPFQTINWLADRAVPKSDKNNPNYLFFANTDGYHFVTLAELMSRPVMVEYTNYPTRNRSDTGGIRDFRDEYLNVISPPKFLNTVDKMSDVQNGMFSSELYVHDIKRKTFERKDIYSYVDNFKKEYHLEEYPTLSSKDITGLCSKPANRLFYPTHHNMHDPIEDNNVSEDWLLKRRSLMEQRQTNRININVWGDSRRRVGEIVKFYHPSMEPIRPGDEKIFDAQTTSKYMISQIKHIFTKERHQMWMTLTRDSLPTAVTEKAEIKGSKKPNPSSFQ